MTMNMTAAEHDPLTLVRRHNAGNTLTLVLALIGGCSGDPASPPLDDPPAAVIESAGPAGAGTAGAGTDGAENPAAFRELIAADWEVPPGTEQYVCVRLTLTETMFVGNWSSEAPFGTHHTILTTSAQPDGAPDGVSECDGATIGTQVAYASGVGTDDFKLPSGVAMKLTQGAQALLNLHLFNPTDKPLRGHSSASIQPMDEKDVRDVADFLTVTALKLDVPPGRSTSQTKCTLLRDATVLGVAPHMHQTGVALQAVAHTAMHGDVMLFDGPYSFEDQQGYPVGPLQFKAGDTVDVTCTYQNPSDTTLHFGQSSKAEMCVLAMVRYPAGGPPLCAK